MESLELLTSVRLHSNELESLTFDISSKTDLITAFPSIRLLEGSSNRWCCKEEDQYFQKAILRKQQSLCYKVFTGSMKCYYPDINGGIVVKDY